MGGGKAVGRLHEQIDSFSRLEMMASAEQGTERLAVHIFHDQARQAAGRLGDCMHDDDVLMAQAGGELGLAVQARAGFIVSAVGTKHLERHDALKVFIQGTKHDAHAAPA
jgi:hypothetical protein